MPSKYDFVIGPDPDSKAKSNKVTSNSTSKTVQKVSPNKSQYDFVMGPDPEKKVKSAPINMDFNAPSAQVMVKNSIKNLGGIDPQIDAGLREQDQYTKDYNAFLNSPKYLKSSADEKMKMDTKFNKNAKAKYKNLFSDKWDRYQQVSAEQAQENKGFLPNLYDRARDAIMTGAGLYANEPDVKANTGNGIVNTAADIVGNIAGFMHGPSPYGASQGSIMNKFSDAIESKAPSALTKNAVGRVLTTAGTNAVATAPISLMNNAAQGKTGKDLLKDTAEESLTMGAFSGAGETIGTILSKIKAGKALTRAEKDVLKNAKDESKAAKVPVEKEVIEEKPQAQKLEVKPVSEIINQDKDIVPVGEPMAKPEPVKTTVIEKAAEPDEKVLKAEPAKNSNTIPMSERSIVAGTDGNVGNKKVKSYQFEHPEVKDNIQSQANYILKYEFPSVKNEIEPTTQVMKDLKDSTKATYAEIKNGLESIVNDHGAENTPVAKRIEMVIDNHLSNGFDSVYGEHFPADVDYLAKKSKIEKVNAPESIKNEDLPVGSINSSVAVPKVQDGAQIAKPTAYRETVFHGSGNTPDEIYNGPQTPIFGKGQYYAFDKPTAEMYGSKVTEHEIGLEKPYVINTPDDYYSLLKKSGNEKTNPLNLSEKDTKEWSAKIQDTLKKDGHDGVVVKFDSPENASNYKYDDLYNVFGHDQLIKLDNPERIKTLGKAPTNAKEETFIKSATDILPDDEQELNKVIKSMQQKIEKSSDEAEKYKLNLQLFAADKKLQEISKFRTNTIERSTLLQDAKEFLPEDEFGYDKESAVQWKNEAVNNLSVNPELVKSKIKKSTQLSSVQEYESALISADLYKKAKETGDYSELSKWLSETGAKTRESARALKATDLAWEKETPMGAIKQSQKIVDGAEDVINKSDIGKAKKVKDDIKEASGMVDKAKKESAEKAVKEKLPEEMLAKKIGGTLKTSDKVNENPLRDMVSELFKVAKESPLPEKELTKSDPIKWLKDTIQNKEKYADVWDKAKTIVKEKYKDDEEALTLLNDYFDKGIIPTYSEKTLNASIKKGMETLGQKVSDIVYVTGRDKQKAIQDLTDLLVKETGASGDDAELLAMQIQSRYSELLKEKSRSILQNMVKERKIVLKKDGMKQIDELINIGAFDDLELANMIKEKNGIPVLTNDDIKKIDEYYSKAAQYKDGSYMNKVYTQKARTLVEDKLPTDMVDKWRFFQRVSMIFNPKTLVTRNPGGNVLLMGVTQIKENTLGAFADYLMTAIKEKNPISALTSENRTTKFMPIEKFKAGAQGLKKGGSEWLSDIKYNVDTSPTHGQMELQKGKIFKGDNPASRFMNALDTLEKRVLQLGDRPFYESSKSIRLAELKRIKKTSVITEEMEADAKGYALDKVFQRDSSLSKIFSRSKNLDNSVGFKLLANTIMPFSQTPANVLDKMIEYGPGGILKAIFKSKKGGVFNQKYFIDNLSSGLTGTGILVLGYYMGKKGLITTKPDTSKKLRDFKSAFGFQNYALHIGNYYYTIDWAQPVATMMLAGAQTQKGSQKGDDEFKKFINSMEAGGDTFFNMSLLKNISSLFGSGNSPMGSVLNTFLGSTTQFTPTAGKQISQLIDPYVRDTSSENMLKEQLNKIMARIPGLTSELPIKTDNFGNPILAYQGHNNARNVMFNPGYLTKDQSTPLQKEMMRLYDWQISPNKKSYVLPAEMPKVLKVKQIVDGKLAENQVPLTTEEWNEYKKTYGDIAQKGDEGIPGLDNLIKTSEYKDASDEVKFSVISHYLNNAQDTAARIMYNRLLKQGRIKIN